MKEFGSIGAFVAHLTTIAVEMEAAEHRILEKSAQLVEKRAKEKIGEYQEQSGEFIAWPELAESTKADRVKQGYTENDPGLRSGEMRDSIRHTVQRPRSADRLERRPPRLLRARHIEPAAAFRVGRRDGRIELPRFAKEISGTAVIAAAGGRKGF